MLCIYKSCLHTLLAHSFLACFSPLSIFLHSFGLYFLCAKENVILTLLSDHEFQVGEHVTCMGSYSCKHIGKESNNASSSHLLPALAPSLVPSAIYKGLRGTSWRLSSTGGTSHFPGFPCWCEHLTECQKRIKSWKWDLCWKNLCWKWIL